MAPRITSTIRTGLLQARPGGAPARMTRPSAWRRMRVVRWSRRNRSSRASGSVARRSIWSSRVSWRCSSDWLRRARLRNTSLRPRRSLASSTAARMAVCRTRSKAWPTRPISSPPVRSDGASAATSTSSPRRSRPTTSGSWTSASWSAERSSPPRRRMMLRPTRMVTVMVTSSPSRPMPAVMATRVHAARLIWRSAASWAFATFTPPVKYWSSTWPASSCHWVSVIGSFATGMPGRHRLLDVGDVGLERAVQLLVEDGQVGGIQHVVRVDHVALPGGGHLRERGAVGLALPVRGQHPGQQRVLLRQRLAGRYRRDQPQGLAGRGGVGQAVGLVEEQPGLVQDARAVALERLPAG